MEIDSRQHAEGEDTYGFVPLAEASCATHTSLLTPCKAQPLHTEMLNVILLLALLFILDAALRCNYPLAGSRVSLAFRVVFRRQPIL